MSIQIEGKVEISVRQLDDLKNEISTRDSKIQQLEEQVKEWESNAKRIVLEKNLFYQPIDIPVYDFGPGPYATTIQQLIASHIRKVREESVRRGLTSSLKEINKLLDTKTEISKSIEYINFSDIENELQMKAEEKVQDKMSKLQSRLNEVASQNLDYQEQLATQKDTLKRIFKQEKEELINKHKEKVKELENQIKILRNEEVEKTKDNTIKELKETIQQLKDQLVAANKRGFWSRLFN